MIFKYYTWNSINRIWMDTKFYCTLCIAKRQKYPGRLTEMIYDCLKMQKLISVPLNAFSVMDYSSQDHAIYQLQEVNGPRVHSLGKLEQMHDGEMARTKSNIKYIDMVLPPLEPLRINGTITINRTIRPDYPVLHMNDEINGGWRPPEGADVDNEIGHLPFEEMPAIVEEDYWDDPLF